jgi:hypothetical protein
LPLRARGSRDRIGNRVESSRYCRYRNEQHAECQQLDPPVEVFQGLCEISGRLDGINDRSLIAEFGVSHCGDLFVPVNPHEYKSDKCAKHAYTQAGPANSVN